MDSIFSLMVEGIATLTGGSDVGCAPYPAGMVESPKFRLEELDAPDLAKLCDDFRAEVFRKAGKQDPNTTPTP